MTEKQEQQILNLQTKYVLNSNEASKLYSVKSEQDSPTLYFSFLPQFAQKLKDQEKGIIFFSNSFILGLIGNNTSGEMVKELEALCKEMSSKPSKSSVKSEVKFDFKIKGQKPLVTKDISQFSITGSDFNVEKINEVLAKHGVATME